jgi:crotonobetainyl-CoA:carnitine CoA-transferase CaiB-like acyl-CoA transferase
MGQGVFPDVPRKMGYDRQISAGRQPSPTSDGYICLAPYNDERWLRFFNMVGRSDLLNNEELNSVRKRQKNREMLYSLAAGLTPTRTTQEWLDLMRAADIPARQVNTLDDLVDDPQLKAVGFFKEKIHPTEGRYLEVRPAVKFSARRNRELGAAPHIGEHNVEVERQLERPDERT